MSVSLSTYSSKEMVIEKEVSRYTTLGEREEERETTGAVVSIPGTSISTSNM